MDDHLGYRRFLSGLPALGPSFGQAALPYSFLHGESGVPNYGPRFGAGTGNKGYGWLGPVARPDGGVSSELSIDVNLDGKNFSIPSMVPALSDQQIQLLLSGGMNSGIVDKAVAHALPLIRSGQSPFYEGSNPFEAFYYMMGK